MNKKYLPILYLTGVVALIVVVGLILIRPDKNADTNLYEYNIDEFKKIDSNIIGYAVIAKIQLKISRPTGIAVDSMDRIFITGKDSLYIFDKNLQKINEYKIKTPVNCIAAGNDNKLYIAIGEHIEVYDKTGKFITRWKDLGKKSVITSVANCKNNIYVADAEENYIYHFNDKGEEILKIGTKDSTEQIKRFIIPSYYFDVAVDPEGKLWVANTGKHLLIQFDENGEVITYWGMTSSDVEGFCGCCNPSHFAIMKDGSFITSEKGIVRVKKYNKKGEFVCVVAGPDAFAEDSKDLDIAIDSEQRIYVLEPKTEMVHVFIKK